MNNVAHIASRVEGWDWARSERWLPVSWGQRETTFYCSNGRGNCAGSGGSGCGRISDDEVCGALVHTMSAYILLLADIGNPPSNLCGFGQIGLPEQKRPPKFRIVFLPGMTSEWQSP
jgi:hypothetical protein